MRTDKHRGLASRLVGGPPVLAMALLAGCASTAARSGESAATTGPAGPSATATPAFPFATDTLRSRTIAPGVIHRFIYSSSGPWAIHVMDVDLGQCYSAVALKGGSAAAGRERTSTLVSRAGATASMVGAVNADFFTTSGLTGIPVGAMVAKGRVITGPYTQPVLAFDSAGRPHIGVLQTNGSAVVGGDRHSITAWNRPAPGGLAFYDAAWGEITDTASSAIEVALSGRSPMRVIAVDTTRAGTAIPREGGVLIAGRNAPALLRAAMLALRAGDAVPLSISLAPMHPMEAVGGRPLLAQDSVIVAAVDTEGQPGFATGRHPRTAAGIVRSGSRGPRLLLVVVDGRQAPYSDGMTLRELANLMLALGAPDAINLDGGGSSTFVIIDPAASGPLHVMNRPSDGSERAVGNALAISHGCTR